MGYNKVIVSGTLIETYEYERELHQSGKKYRAKQGVLDDRVMGDSGANKQQAESVRKKNKRRPDNAKRAAVVFRRLVAAQLDGVACPLLITLTYARNETSLKVGYSDFRRFIQLARRQFGLDFKYIAVPEFQRRGAVHFHALFWGLPEEVLGQERHTRLVAKLWGCGFVFLKQTDGDRKIAAYLAKYMSKAYLDDRLAGLKAFTSSQNLIRPVAVGRNGPLWPVFEDLKVIPSHQLKESSYDTQWLGRCIYKQILKQDV